MPIRWTAAMLLTALALIAAGCGGGETDSADQAPPTAPDAQALVSEQSTPEAPMTEAPDERIATIDDLTGEVSAATVKNRRISPGTFARDGDIAVRLISLSRQEVIPTQAATVSAYRDGSIEPPAGKVMYAAEFALRNGGSEERFYKRREFTLLTADGRQLPADYNASGEASRASTLLNTIDPGETERYAAVFFTDPAEEVVALQFVDPEDPSDPRGSRDKLLWALLE